MNPSLLSLFKFIQLTSGRRLHAFRELRLRARKRGLHALVAHLERAIAHEKRTHELNQRWRKQGRTRTVGGPDIGTVDGLTDQTLTSLRDMLTGNINGALPGDVKAAIAERVRAAIFPNKVAAVTSLPFVEELAALEVILDKLQDELQAEMSELSLTHMVVRLAKLFDMYQSALDEGAHQLWFRDVKGARVRGHLNMLEAVSQILGQFFAEEDPDHAQARAELLEPIFEQDQAYRDYLRARRTNSGADGEVDGDVDVDVDDDGDIPVDLDADDDADADAEPAAATDTPDDQ
jgi:hypothetical protein